VKPLKNTGTTKRRNCSTSSQRGYERQSTKLPADVADKLTTESADEIAQKISKELNVPKKKSGVSTETGSCMLQLTTEGLVLAEKRLSKTEI